MTVNDRVLLDTHALLWWATNDRKLGSKVRRLIQNQDAKVFVSAATAWEIATKVRLGKLSWTGAIAWPQPHGDPFDRMLAAQSSIEDLPLATDDRRIALFGIETVW